MIASRGAIGKEKNMSISLRGLDLKVCRVLPDLPIRGQSVASIPFFVKGSGSYIVLFDQDNNGNPYLGWISKALFYFS